MRISRTQRGELLRLANAVGRVEHRAGLGSGTGFLVGPDIVITNNHVLPSRQAAQSWIFVLHAERQQFGALRRLAEIEFDPDRFFMTSEALDFTLVAIKPGSHDADAFTDVVPLPLSSLSSQNCGWLS